MAPLFSRRVMDYLTAKGWLTEKERRYLNVLSQAVPDKKLILNVGVEFGASVVCFAEGNPNVRITGVDIEALKAPQLLDYPNFKFIQRDSSQLLLNWKQPIFLAFIDGDHSEHGVKKDAEYSQFIQHGGYLLFHDCYSWDEPGGQHKVCPEVNRVVSAWFALRKDQWAELPFVDSIRVFKRK